LRKVLSNFDGLNGFIADDTETCAKVTLKLIEDRDLWHKLGKQAHLRVKNKYLLPVMIIEYLESLINALGMSHITGQAQLALESTSSSLLEEKSPVDW
jgi:hypothetical protein